MPIQSILGQYVSVFVCVCVHPGKSRASKCHGSATAQNLAVLAHNLAMSTTKLEKSYICLPFLHGFAGFYTFFCV